MNIAHFGHFNLSIQTTIYPETVPLRPGSTMIDAVDTRVERSRIYTFR